MSAPRTLHDLVLHHYSDRELKKLAPVDVDRPSGAYKPGGFWLSVDNWDDGWRQWCEAEKFRPDALRYAHRIVLRKSARVLWLRSAAAIDRFTQEYAAADASYGIIWRYVALDYQGVIIAPYVWARRIAPHTHWYYGWDCASGCIWDTDAIESINVENHESVEAVA